MKGFSEMDLLQIKKMENLIWTIEHSSDLSKRFYIIKFFDRENTIKPIETLEFGNRNIDKFEWVFINIFPRVVTTYVPSTGRKPDESLIDKTRENSKESLILQGIRTYTKFWSC
ncbi:hypothetical protein ABH957_002249 [Bacillus sp. RC242]